MLFVKSDRPVDPLTLMVMHEVDAVVRELELSYFLCGAMARDVLLQHVHGIQTGTATADVDFGVAVESWDMFENIKSRLTATGRFVADKKRAQHLDYTNDVARKGYPIDIIPFGGVESPPNSIKWPPEMGIVMNVTGYDEALANASDVQVENGFVIPVISLPALALLKLFAWTDRGAGEPKDALDLVTLLRTYHDAGNHDRLYGEELELLEEAAFDPAVASPKLLGKDVRKIARPETLEQALDVLENVKLRDRLVMHMARGIIGADDRIESAQRLLDQFHAGLSGT